MLLWANLGPIWGQHTFCISLRLCRYISQDAMNRSDVFPAFSQHPHLRVSVLQQVRLELPVYQEVSLLHALQLRRSSVFIHAVCQG